MPSSPGYVRDYKAEYEGEKKRGEAGTGHNSGTAVRERARRQALKLGLVKKGQDLDHKKPVSKGGKNVKSNYRAETPHQNRSFPRDKNGAMIRNSEATPPGHDKK